MAARSRRSNIFRRTFKDDPLLKQYLLEGVKPTGKELGRGSYGSVIEVKYQRTICAAKEMHEILLDLGNEGVEDFVTKYKRECQLMASVSHPNLTQFLGLCFVGTARLPLLVMERLEMNLDELLAGELNISFSLKLSLLHDTCNGLVYLHSRQPPIVHRDLTARNVLISSSRTAKIADFGCSRIIDIKSGQFVRTMSKIPGTLVYMPPEALDDTHRYGPSLDVFSFGHLSLYAFIQESPDNLLSFNYPDPSNREHIIARSEVERRQPYMATLQTQLARSHPALFELVRQCLHNAPERRPSSVEALRILLQVKVEVEGETEKNSKQKEEDKHLTTKKRMAQSSQLVAQSSELVAQNSQFFAEVKKLNIKSSDKKKSSKPKKFFKQRKPRLEPVENIDDLLLHIEAEEPIPSGIKPYESLLPGMSLQTDGSITKECSPVEVEIHKDKVHLRVNKTSLKAVSRLHNMLEKKRHSEDSVNGTINQLDKLSLNALSGHAPDRAYFSKDFSELCSDLKEVEAEEEEEELRSWSIFHYDPPLDSSPPDSA